MHYKGMALISCVIILAFAAGASAFTTEQASRGQELYGQHCAVCHGANGQGGTVPAQFGKLAGMKASPVVGPGYLPGMKTVGQVYKFASKKMPAEKPGSLKSSEYIDIIAFALQANGIKADGNPLTPGNAKQIKLPREASK